MSEVTNPSLPSASIARYAHRGSVVGYRTVMLVSRILEIYTFKAVAGKGSRSGTTYVKAVVGGVNPVTS